MAEEILDSIRLLVIDDSDDFRRLVAHYVAAGWREPVIVEWDPFERGVLPQSFGIEGFDVILLDYRLGDEDGLAWLRQLVMRENCPPIVFVTGEGGENVAVEALKAGAFDYVSKHALSKGNLLGALREAAAAKAAGGRTADAVPAVGEYRIVRRIGGGAMAEVFLGERVSDGAQHALKILDPSLVEDAEFVARFEREHDLLATIDDSSVVRIHGRGWIEEGGGVGSARPGTPRRPWIAMEYFAGGNLREGIRGRLSPREALAVLDRIATALAVVHAEGIVHRDLKPDNVLFRADGTLALVDFGIARSARAKIDITMAGDVLGTPNYMSPEQAMGLPLDGRSDLYCAGILLYEMLVGQRPWQFEGSLKRARARLTEPLPRLPLDLIHYQDLIERLTSLDPAARFQSAGELRVYLALMGLDTTVPEDLPLVDSRRIEDVRRELAALPGAAEARLRSLREAITGAVRELEDQVRSVQPATLAAQAHAVMEAASLAGGARLAAHAEALGRLAASGVFDDVGRAIEGLAACARDTCARLEDFAAKPSSTGGARDARP